MDNFKHLKKIDLQKVNMILKIGNKSKDVIIKISLHPVVEIR